MSGLDIDVLDADLSRPATYVATACRWAPSMLDEIRRLRSDLAAARAEASDLRDAHADLMAICSVPAFTGTVDEFEAWLAGDGKERPALALSRAEILRLRGEVRDLRGLVGEACDVATQASYYAHSDIGAEYRAAVADIRARAEKAGGR